MFHLRFIATGRRISQIGASAMNQRVDLKETMSKVLKKWWLIVLLVVALGLGARFISATFISKIYEAKATMFIGKEQGASGTNISLTDLEASNKLIADYKEIANSRFVIDVVIKKLNMNTTEEVFRQAMTISTIENSRLFTVSFSDNDPQLASKVANEIALQLSTAVADIVNVENIRIIDSAQPPKEAVFPNVNIITLLAAVIGLVVSLLIIYLTDIFNDSFSSREAIENELHLDVLAMIPKFREDRNKYSKNLTALMEPNSYLAESFKMLRTNINYLIRDGQHKVIMLTSSVEPEGKTTTSCNLAITMAQEHKRVLLIDGDLRKPSIFKIFKVTMIPGLTDIIYGKYSLSEAVQHSVDVPGLDLLTAGRQSSMTTELLGSISFQKIIDEAREHYDAIIIDAPPVMNLSDTIIISKIVDKVLFVVAMDATSRPVVREAKKNLDKVQDKMMGMILTNMSINPKNYYYNTGGRKKRLRK